MNRANGHLIVHVFGFYPPYLGGLPYVTKTLAEMLAERHTVEMLTTTCGSQGAPRCERRGRLLVRRYRGIEIAHTPIAPGLFFRLLRLPRHAVVHAHTSNPFVPEVVWLTSLLRRRPFIAHFHGPIGPSGRFGWLLPAYQRYVFGPVLRAASCVIVLTSGQAELVQSHFGVSPKRMVVQPYGIAPEFFVARDQRVDARRETMRLLFVGRLVRQKNVPCLLEALRLVTSPVELAIVGDGEDRDLVARRIEQLGLSNVRLVGAQRGAELLEWYRWADVFVMPSSYEGLGLVLLEAMAAGVPVVAPDVPGPREIVDGVGLLAPAEPAALAKAITRLAEDPDLRRDLAERGVTRARSFSWDTVVAELEDIYERIAR